MATEPAKEYVTFTIDPELLQRVDEIAAMFRRKRSPQIEILIMKGMGYPVEHLLTPPKEKR